MALIESRLAYSWTQCEKKVSTSKRRVIATARFPRKPVSLEKAQIRSAHAKAEYGRWQFGYGCVFLPRSGRRIALDGDQAVKQIWSIFGRSRNSRKRRWTSERCRSRRLFRTNSRLKFQSGSLGQYIPSTFAKFWVNQLILESKCWSQGIPQISIRGIRWSLSDYSDTVALLAAVTEVTKGGWKWPWLQVSISWEKFKTLLTGDELLGVSSVAPQIISTSRPKPLWATLREGRWSFTLRIWVQVELCRK